MQEIMEREERNKLLNYLNEHSYPFRDYKFVQDYNGNMKQLGNGGYAYIYECRSNDKEDVKAVKIIGFQSANMSDDDTGLFMKETECQKRIAAVCPNVVNITDSASLYVEYDNSGRIRDVIRSKEELTGNPDNYRMFHFILMEKLKPILGYSASGKPYVLDEKMRMDESSRAGIEENILDFGIDIANALKAAHSKKIVHRDVKLENTFYDVKKGIYKLGDFGIARETENGNASTHAGTRGNVAPEAEMGGKYDATKADIYSLGMMLYLLLNELNYPGSTGYSVKREIQYNPIKQPFPMPVYGSKYLVDIVMKACSYKPEDRYDSVDSMYNELVELKNRWNTINSNLSEDKPVLDTELMKKRSIEMNSKKDISTEIEEAASYESPNNTVKFYDIFYRDDDRLRKRIILSRKIDRIRDAVLFRLCQFAGVIGLVFGIIQFLGIMNPVAIENTNSKMLSGVLLLCVASMILALIGLLLKRYSVFTFDKKSSLYDYLYLGYFDKYPRMLAFMAAGFTLFSCFKCGFNRLYVILIVAEIIYMLTSSGVMLISMVSTCVVFCYWVLNHYDFSVITYNLPYSVIYSLLYICGWMVLRYTIRNRDYGYGEYSNDSDSMVFFLGESVILLIAGVVISLISHFAPVHMPELLDRSGLWIAGLIGIIESIVIMVTDYSEAIIWRGKKVGKWGEDI